MRLRALFSRLALATAASGLAVTGLSVPAQAAEEVEVPYIGILSPETVTIINGQSKTVKFDLYNLSDVSAKNVVLTFGSAAKPVSADLGFTAPAGCDANVCAIGDLAPGQRRSVKFTLKPAAAAGAADPAKAIALSTTVGAQPSDETSITVVRTDKGGVDLEVDDIADLKLAQGRTADVPVMVRNSGNKDVAALGLLVMAPYGVSPVLDYSNCEREAEVGGFICVFNEPLTAGAAFTLPKNTPLRVKVPSDAAGPFEYPVYVGAIGLTEKYVFDFTKRTAGASGKALELEAVSSAAAEEPETVEDLNEDDNYAIFSVTVPKTTAETAAVGGAFTGEIGEEHTVEVGLRNLGPSGTVPPSIASLQYAHIKLPTGIELMKIDERCMPGTSLTDVDESVTDLAKVTDLVCLVVESVPNKGRYLFSLSAEILDVAEHKAGSVTINGGVQDKKKTNNKAALTVKLTSGGSGGGDGGLPITGAPAGLIAGGGAVLLAAGFIAFRAARRRRIITVAE